MEKESLIMEIPVKISTCHLQVDSKQENVNCSILKRVHSPSKSENSSLPKKPLLIEKKSTVSPYQIKNESKTNICLPKDNLHIEEACRDVHKSATLQDSETSHERENSLFSEEETFEDNLKINKENIKKRRFSFGRCLRSINSPKKLIVSSETTDISGIGPIIVPGPGIQNLENEKVLAEVNIKQENLLIKKYDELSKKLNVEYQAWKSLQQLRKQHVLEAQRELREANEHDTLIEEDYILSHLNKEQKAILLSQPDYEQYLEEIKLVLERLVLTQQEVETVSLIYQNFVNKWRIISQSYYAVIEENVFGEKKENDPKLLLKSLLNFDNSHLPSYSKAF